MMVSMMSKILMPYIVRERSNRISEHSQLALGAVLSGRFSWQFRVNNASAHTSDGYSGNHPSCQISRAA